MTESQSRYSIVERLTQSKLEVLEGETQLDIDLKRLEQEIEKKKENLANWRKDIQEDIKRLERERIREIQETEKQLSAQKEHQESKRSLFSAKICELDKALSSIETISKSITERDISE